MIVVIETKEKSQNIPEDLDDLWSLVFKQTNQTSKNEVINCIVKEIEGYEQISYLDKIIEQHKSVLIGLNEQIINYLIRHNPSEEYKTFRIPKNSGGYREINEPNEDLKNLQKAVQLIFYNLKLLSSRWSYAYEKQKSIIKLAENHKSSNYFLKMDLKHFFNSIDRDILEEQLNNIYQFNKIKEFIPDFTTNIINLALRNNELPQGSPLSPILSNLIAIKLDLKIKKDEKIKNLYYTRYADDLIFSSKSYISKNIVENELSNILDQIYNKKIKINKEKTKLLTKNQRLYIVGIKINKDNEMSYGHEKKKALKLAIYNLFKSKEYGTWIKEEAQEVLGKFAFMAQIEPNYAKYLKSKFCKKFNIKEEKFYSYLINE